MQKITCKNCGDKYISIPDINPEKEGGIYCHRFECAIACGRDVRVEVDQDFTVWERKKGKAFSENDSYTILDWILHPWYGLGQVTKVLSEPSCDVLEVAFNRSSKRKNVKPKPIRCNIRKALAI